MRGELLDPLSPEDALALQEKFFRLTAHQTALYTMGESTSLPEDTARELMASLSYTLGMDHAPPEKLRELARSDLQQEYEKGVRRIERKLQVERQLCAAALQISTPSESLAITLHSIGGFARRYDARRFAHQVPCDDIDYPLCHPVSETLCGVDYVAAYLHRVLLEDAFLRRFNPTRLALLWARYCPGYRTLTVNLYEPAAANVLGLALLGEDPLALTVSPEQCRILSERLSPLSGEQLAFALKTAGEAACAALSLENAAERNYFLRFALSCLPRIRAAAPELSEIFLAFDVPR